jgi:hypothetical protein
MSTYDNIPPTSRLHCVDVGKLPDKCLLAEIDNINRVMFL